MKPNKKPKTIGDIFKSWGPPGGKSKSMRHLRKAIKIGKVLPHAVQSHSELPLPPSPGDITRQRFGLASETFESPPCQHFAKPVNHRTRGAVKKMFERISNETGAVFIVGDDLHLDGIFTPKKLRKIAAFFEKYHVKRKRRRSI